MGENKVYVFRQYRFIYFDKEKCQQRRNFIKTWKMSYMNLYSLWKRMLFFATASVWRTNTESAKRRIDASTQKFAEQSLVKMEKYYYLLVRRFVLFSNSSVNNTSSLFLNAFTSKGDRHTLNPREMDSIACAKTPLEMTKFAYTSDLWLCTK